MARARKGPRKPKSKAGRNLAGQFFERFALPLVGGELSTDQDLGDIVNDTLSLGVEVKAADSNNGHTLRVEQKDKYLRMRDIGFPLEHFAYLLCCYPNDVGKKKGMRQRRPLSVLKSNKEREAYLAGNVDRVFLLDIEIINAFERKFGTIPCRHPFRGDELDIPVRRGALKPFTNGATASWLKDLGLTPCDFRRGEYNLRTTVCIQDRSTEEVRTYTPDFLFITVLKKDFHEKFVLEQDYTLVR